MYLCMCRFMSVCTLDRHTFQVNLCVNSHADQGHGRVRQTAFPATETNEWVCFQKEDLSALCDSFWGMTHKY